MLSEEFYRILWRTEGFKPEDLPEEKWKQLTDEFLRLYQEYCTFTKEKHIFEYMNDEFDEEIAPGCDKGAGGIDSYLYGSYMAYKLNGTIRTRMELNKDFMKSDLLEPFFYLDGWLPDLGMRLKQYPGWSMTYGLVEVG